MYSIVIYMYMHTFSHKMRGIYIRMCAYTYICITSSPNSEASGSAIGGGGGALRLPNIPPNIPTLKILAIVLRTPHSPRCFLTVPMAASLSVLVPECMCVCKCIHIYIYVCVCVCVYV